MLLFKYDSESVCFSSRVHPAQDHLRWLSSRSSMRNLQQGHTVLQYPDLTAVMEHARLRLGFSSLYGGRIAAHACMHGSMQNQMVLPFLFTANPTHRSSSAPCLPPTVKPYNRQTPPFLQPFPTVKPPSNHRQTKLHPHRHSHVHQHIQTEATTKT